MDIKRGACIFLLFFLSFGLFFLSASGVWVHFVATDCAPGIESTSILAGSVSPGIGKRVQKYCTSVCPEYAEVKGENFKGAMRGTTSSVRPPSC